MTNNPILFNNSILNVNGEEMKMMYFYSDHFIMEREEQIAVIDKANFPDELLEEILSNKENQQEITEDEKLLEMLDNLILQIKKQEGEDEDGE